jgi:putative transposase
MEDGKELPVKQLFSESISIGIDIRITDFFMISIGEKVENRKYLKNSLKKVKVF